MAVPRDSMATVLPSTPPVPPMPIQTQPALPTSCLLRRAAVITFNKTSFIIISFYCNHLSQVLQNP